MASRRALSSSMLSCMNGLRKCSSIQGCLRTRWFHQRRRFCATASPRLARLILIARLSVHLNPAITNCVFLQKDNGVVDAQKLARFRWNDARVAGHAVEMIEALER